jgi:alkylation response protein AidB-like acyl-CoA dehydrogenase
VSFLTPERGQLESLLPGFDAVLQDMGLAALEQDSGPALAAFKQAGGPGLLIPRDLGGIGADPVAAVQVQRAIGSRSPSLAVATTMHHFSVATIVEMTDRGLESILLEGVATGSLLVASGFGEGKPGQGVLSPGMTAKRSGKGIVISGVKRPCSLGMSMDLLTVSVRVDGRLAVVLVPPTLPGVTRRPFWQSPALMGAESCEIVLDEVEVPARLVSYSGAEDVLDATQIGAFLWFEALICASYIGAASRLAEMALGRPETLSPQLTSALAQLEMAMAAVERFAGRLTSAERCERMLGQALLIRYGVQDAIFAAAASAAELIGGVGFASAPDVALLIASVRALAYHPPSRVRMAAPLGDWLAGARLRLE